MDKINIVSSQAVLEMPSFSMGTCSMSSSPLVNGLVKNRLLKNASHIDEPTFEFIHTMDLSAVDTMLHDLVVHRNEIWAVCKPQVGRKKVCIILLFNSFLKKCMRLHFSRQCSNKIYVKWEIQSCVCG